MLYYVYHLQYRVASNVTKHALPYSTKVSRDKTFAVRSPCEFKKFERLHQKHSLLDLFTQSVMVLIKLSTTQLRELSGLLRTVPDELLT